MLATTFWLLGHLGVNVALKGGSTLQSTTKENL